MLFAVLDMEKSYTIVKNLNPHFFRITASHNSQSIEIITNLIFQSIYDPAPLRNSLHITTEAYLQPLGTVQ